jgi:glycosyltransferase involved in cell wall biosynthesis
MEVEFVRRLAADMAAGTIVLVGPVEDPDPALVALPRVVHVPPQPYDILPQLAAAADVLIMPYADLPVTRAMQPLKLKEYLATGKPAVVRDLPAVAEWADCLDVTRTADEFSALVRKRLAVGLDPAQREARRRLEEEAWAAKARQFEHWLKGGAAEAVVCAVGIGERRIVSGADDR